MKKAIIAIGGLGIVAIGVGYFLYNKQNKLSEKDFDAMVSLTKNKGMDIFEDASPREMNIAKNNYLKYFNIKSHNDFLSLLSKGEKNWNVNEKKKAKVYLNKTLTGLTKV